MQRAEARSRRADSRGDIQAWMARRWSDLERRSQGAPVKAERISLTEPEPLQGLVAIEPGAGPDLAAPESMDLGLRFRAPRPGDSISRLIGSSDPAAIGKFLSLNGMDGRSSTLRAGRSYVVPTRWDDATAGEAAAGEALLASDNVRLRELAEQRAADERQAKLLLEGRNIWSGASTEAAPRGPLLASGIREMRRSGLDDDPTAKAAAGALGWGLGLVPGAVRGGFNTVKDAGESALFVYRLASPSEMLTPQGRLAREQLFDGGRRVGGYVMRSIEDPSIVRDDIEAALHDFQLKQNPFAAPPTDTLAGEFRRAFDIGMNNGELAFDAGSLLVGGGFIRGAAGLGAAAKAASAKEIAFLAANPGFAARLELPYSGMGHHIIGRNERLPALLGGGKYPRWFIESDFNKIREQGMTTRDFYRNHVGVDDQYHGGRIGRAYGGGGWSAKTLGWTDYGAWDRLNYGTSPLTKAIVGPTLFGGTLVDSIDKEARR